MRVKRYVADSIQEAISRVKNDLGRNAIILHTKPFKEGGFLGLFSQRRFEVIAAVDENLPDNTQKKSEPKPEAGVTANASPVNTVAVSTMINPAIPNQVNQGANFIPLVTEPVTSQATTIPTIPRTNSFVTSGQQETNVNAEPVLNSLREEIAEMKELIKQVATKPAAPTLTIPNHSNSNDTRGLDGFRQYLQQLGLEGEIIDYLLLQVPGYLVENNNVSPEQWSAYCQQVLGSKLMFSEPIQTQNQGEQQIMALIGPTGVGKTTTIAKLAANYNLFEGKKVGLITIDTYRIAAVEHLKTYGDIINLPVEVVYTPADLNQSFQNLRDCDLILIDTAGRSPHNQAMMDELKKFLSHSKIGLILLAISATTKYQDMVMIAENFSRIAYTHLVFTKLDETDCFGPIVSLAWKIRRPISYLTTGQNVPDDIEIARSDKLISYLIK